MEWHTVSFASGNIHGNGYCAQPCEEPRPKPDKVIDCRVQHCCNENHRAKQQITTRASKFIVFCPWCLLSIPQVKISCEKLWIPTVIMVCGSKCAMPYLWFTLCEACAHALRSYGVAVYGCSSTSRYSCKTTLVVMFPTIRLRR